ncbi:hypothetical protein OESDEN_02472 [Oesophagostomum dentatum]|uniref:Reverse transcriptase RNase H-like domain-containing protein n=1 Tax=Oesophagostomum dentatum TaxID=61180 RepID=A0A0B1TNY4_OESDE|nr:hypothetical protein OESDEN_02472 [Oesophagostomum dentatum]
MNVNPDTHFHELLNAQQQIEALTVSLHDHQTALQNSEERVLALTKRNQELAESTFGRPASTHKPLSSALPDVRLLLVCSMVLSTFLPCSSLSSSAWLCPREPSDVIARIPLSYNCSRLIPRVNATPIPLAVHIFRPNTQRYDTPAYLCRIITRSVEYYVNFFGARTESHTETYQIVSVEACKLMHLHHKCTHGTLDPHGDSFSTANQLAFDWPSAPFGCCVTRSVSVTNCYLISTVIHTRHGSKFPDSAIGDLHQCQYSSGSCTLPDGSALIWTPNQEETCQFIPIAKMRGHQLGEVWISDSKEFALSWHDSNERLNDCGRQLIVSDQGYAIMTVQRFPRSSLPRVGMVTSNQLAAQLLAVEDTVQVAVSALFHHALSALCDRTNLLALSLHSALASNPTYTLRNLLNRHDIAASYLGNGKALSESQRKWSPTHIELFAIISALRFFRAIIYGNHTTIFSDHRPLTYLLKHNKTHDNLARWVIELQSYDVSIVYHKGSSNVVADALSRSVDKHVHFEDDSPDANDIIEFPVSINKVCPTGYTLLSPIVYASTPSAIRPYDALLAQKADSLCSPIMTFLEMQRFPTTSTTIRNLPY